MKKILAHIILTVAALLALSGCSHNNGDIGPWFGLWHLDAIEIDGEPDTDYDGNYYFLFQGKVFCIRWVNDQQHELIESYAQWQESDDGTIMTVNFVDNRFSPRVDYTLPDPHLSIVTIFNVRTINSHEMLLDHTDPNTGITYTYYLTHWD